MAKGLYITGTDTGVGKTRVATALVTALRGEGLQVAGMKPVASGCERRNGVWCNDDALALQRVSSPPIPPYSIVNPYAFALATAPEIAAARDGGQVEVPPIVQAYRRLSSNADWVIVEGVGGWAAPLAPRLEQAALVHALGRLPVLLVVGLRLGCISHARLSARAIDADGLKLAGWVANTIDPRLLEAEATLDVLQRALPAPCLGRIAHARSAAGASVAQLVLGPLLAG